MILVPRTPAIAVRRIATVMLVAIIQVLMIASLEMRKASSVYLDTLGDTILNIAGHIFWTPPTFWGMTHIPYLETNNTPPSTIVELT